MRSVNRGRAGKTPVVPIEGVRPARKLDELIRVIEGAHNALLDLEELEESELDLIRARYCKLADRARADLRRGIKDTDAPDFESDEAE